jgi:hypothetical protein
MGVSRVGGSPITGLGEDMRQNDGAMTSRPGLHEMTRQIIGIVDAVDDTYARWVTAHEPTGKTILAGRWIELNHSAREIAERYGTVPVGTMIRVTVYGPGDGVSASATIIDTEGKGADEPHYSNDAEQGMYAVFCPGSSIG